jgi:hypothetical protein
MYRLGRSETTGEPHRGERQYTEVLAGPQRGRMPERRGRSRASDSPLPREHRDVRTARPIEEPRLVLPERLGADAAKRGSVLAHKEGRCYYSAVGLALRAAIVEVSGVLRGRRFPLVGAFAGRICGLRSSALLITQLRKHVDWNGGRPISTRLLQINDLLDEPENLHVLLLVCIVWN